MFREYLLSDNCESIELACCELSVTMLCLHEPMVDVFDGMLDLSRSRTIARARIQHESLSTYSISQMKPPLTLLPCLLCNPGGGFIRHAELVIEAKTSARNNGQTPETVLRSHATRVCARRACEGS